MNDLWRLLKLFRPYGGWLALGILTSLATLIANVTLMQECRYLVKDFGTSLSQNRLANATAFVP